MKINTDEELKPCPFCNEPPAVAKTGLVSARNVFVVRCINMKCPAMPLVSDKVQLEVIKSWNTRGS